MEKLPFDLNTLPEPLKSMAQNLDPAMIQNFVSMYDPATLTLMMNTMFAMFKDSLPPDQAESLKDLMEKVVQLIPENKKSE